METGQMQDIIYDLMKGKITLAEFFETTDNSTGFIEYDFEDGSFPKPVADYCTATLTKLKRIKEK